MPRRGRDREKVICGCGILLVCIRNGRHKKLRFASRLKIGFRLEESPHPRKTSRQNSTAGSTAGRFCGRSRSANAKIKQNIRLIPLTITMNTKSNRHIIPVFLAAGLASAFSCSWPVAAQDMNSDTDGNARGIYLGWDMGASFLQNIVNRGEVAGFVNPGQVVAFNVGSRFDLNLGYNICDHFSVEVQTGFGYNSVSSFDGVSLDDSGIDVEVWTVPVMANGIYKYSFNDHWQAYGGLGAGVVISTLDQSTFLESTSTTDCTFGYQAMFGIKYIFGPRWEAGLGYNFLGSLDHHWSVDGVGFTTSPTYQHSILLSFTRKF